MAKILDVKIDNYSFSEVIEKITSFLKTDNFHQIVTVNPEFVLEAQKDAEFRNIINSASLSIPDGFGLQCASLFLRQKIGERVTGVDLTWEIAKIASEKGKSIFLLGGKEGVADIVAQRMKLIYPNLIIAGTYAGKPDDEKTIDIIQKAKPDIMFVAFGAPKQDKFIHNLNLEPKTFNLPRIAIGIGGTLDYIAGVVPRAPKWLRSIGLEWFYRLIKEPKRFKRIFNAVIIFPFLVLVSRFK